MYLRICGCNDISKPIKNGSHSDMFNITGSIFYCNNNSASFLLHCPTSSRLCCLNSASTTFSTDALQSALAWLSLSWGQKSPNPAGLCTSVHDGRLGAAERFPKLFIVTHRSDNSAGQQRRGRSGGEDCVRLSVCLCLCACLCELTCILTDCELHSGSGPWLLQVCMSYISPAEHKHIIQLFTYVN